MATTPIKTAVMVGPSIDLPRPRRLRWVKRILRQSRPGFLVGVDGGIEYLAGERPDLVIGDWDSGSASRALQFARAGARIVTLPRGKDYSDLHFALEMLPDAEELVLIGFTGGRPDHLLANWMEISRFAAARAAGRKFQKIAAIGPEAGYHFLTHRQPPLQLNRIAPTQKGECVSVFAWGGPAQGVTMTGFEYDLKNARLEPSSRGLSNVIRARQAKVGLRKGALLVVVPGVG